MPNVPAQVSAVLVTRGDVDMTEILESIDTAGIRDVVIYNNALEQDLAVYGRYHAIGQARHDVVYVQDDDCVLVPGSINELVAAYEPVVAVCNIPERFRPHYPDSGLVGFGAVFDRGLPAQAFGRFTAALGDAGWPIDWPYGPSPLRRADNVFTALTRLKLADLPYRDLPWASAPNRMWKQPEHVGERDRMIALARQVRDELLERAIEARDR